MFHKLAIPPSSEDGFLQWHTSLPDDIPEGSCFYIDGSAMDADSRQLTRFGFAIVAVDDHGVLRGIANGTTPAFVRSAAGAELWGLPGRS